MIERCPGGIIVSIRVIPRAARSGIGGTRDGALLVRVNAPPVEGAANEAVVQVLAAVFEVPKRQVTIVSGTRGRNKRVQIAGITPDTAAAKLQASTE